VEHQQTDVRQVSGRVASADSVERFLRELRQLRDSAGLGHAELAARAHYPYDSIRAAEVGPELPDLPVLSAFVRGCGGTTEEWEERWRALTKTPSLPVSEARNTGGSAAAEAGARIGSVSPAGDNPDASIILAALNRVAEGMASGSDTAAPEGEPDDASRWPDFPPEAATGHSPGVPAGFEPDLPAPATAGEPAAGGFPSAAGGLPGTAGGFPSGWDPIRVSTAWPAIPDSPIDAAFSTEAGAEAPPWESAPWAGESPATASAGSAKAPGATAGNARAVAARSPGRAAARRGPAGSSRIWMVAVAVALLCVLAVVLAIFA
jgi:hypothetical protein